VIEALLKLLNDDEFLTLYGKLVRERSRTVWPTPPNEGEIKAQLKQLHGMLLSAGVDRGLGSALLEREAEVREQLADLRRRTGGIIMSD
jgi:hypothetical protein